MLYFQQFTHENQKINSTKCEKIVFCTKWACNFFKSKGNEFHRIFDRFSVESQSKKDIQIRTEFQKTFKEQLSELLKKIHWLSEAKQLWRYEIVNVAFYIMICPIVLLIGKFTQKTKNNNKSISIHESSLFHILLENVFYFNGIFCDLILFSIVLNAIVKN